MKNKIIESVYNNKLLNEAIDNIVEKKWREDFKSHFITQLMAVDEAKLIGLYERREIDWFCLKIITNQWKSTTSTFWKLYRNNGFNGVNPVYYTDVLFNEREEVKEEESIFIGDVSEIEKRVEDLLDIQYSEFLINQYHKKIFQMRHFQKMSVGEIAEETSIHYRAVLRSIHKTEKYIKNKIINGTNNNNF